MPLMTDTQYRFKRVCVLSIASSILCACGGNEVKMPMADNPYDPHVRTIRTPADDQNRLLWAHWVSGDYQEMMRLSRELEDDELYMMIYEPPLLDILCDAAGAAKYEMATRLIFDGADVNGVTRTGETPLLAACGAADARMVRLLLQAGADPNHPRYLTPWPIHAASSSGNVAVVEALIEAGADPNQADLDRNRPLHRAAKWVRCEAVEYLLSVGADPAIEDELGLPPLWHAVQAGSPQCVRHLLDHGANPLSTHRFGYFNVDISKPENYSSSNAFVGMAPMNAIEFARFLLDEPKARGVIYWDTRGEYETWGGVYDDGDDRTPLRGGKYQEVLDVLHEHVR